MEVENSGVEEVDVRLFVAVVENSGLEEGEKYFEGHWDGELDGVEEDSTGLYYLDIGYYSDHIHLWDLWVLA